MTRDTFAVALVGEEDRGWLIDAESAGEAQRIVRGTVPRAHEVWESELLVWLGSAKFRGVKVADIDARTSIRRPRTPVRLSDGGRFRRLTPRNFALPLGGYGETAPSLRRRHSRNGEQGDENKHSRKGGHSPGVACRAFGASGSSHRAMHARRPSS